MKKDDVQKAWAGITAQLARVEIRLTQPVIVDERTTKEIVDAANKEPGAQPKKPRKGKVKRDKNAS